MKVYQDFHKIIKQHMKWAYQNDFWRFVWHWRLE